MSQHYQVLILGSGPAGTTAAVYAARAGLHCALVTGITPGGQLTITTDVDNWPGGVEGLQGPALMQDMQAHAARCGAHITSDHIIEATLQRAPWQLVGTHETYSCDALIIATGADARYLGLPSEEAFKGKGVSACATCDGFFFRNQDVAVIGGGNTALEEVLYLANITRHVTLIHRRRAFRAEQVLIDRMQQLVDAGKVTLCLDHTLQEVLGNEQGVHAIQVTDVHQKKQQTLAVTGVFIAIGHDPNTKLFKGQLDRDDHDYLFVHNGRDGMATQTSQPGVFAAGDVADPVYRQAVTSAGSGCMAALDAKRYIEENS